MTPPALLNVAAHVPALARSRPHAPAVVCPVRRRRGRVAYVHYTFAQLDEASDRLAHALMAAGIRRGARTVLMVTPSLEFFALTFALFKLGAVLVLIDPGMGVRNLGRCLAEAEPEAFVGIPKAHLARRLLGWARRTLRVLLTTGRATPGGGERSLDRLAESVKPGQPFPMAEPAADETAAILFTSGSTGPAKGAVYTHGTFAAQIELLRRLYDIGPGEIDLCTFPLFALFGPALGMTAVIPDMDATRPARADPRKLIEAIEDFGVTNLFGSPALLNRLGRYGVENCVKLPTLKRVISAGAPVPATTIERVTQMLAPGVQVFTPYGATEALPVASIGSDEILNETRFATEKGAGVCVGRPVEGVRVEVIRISDEPIPTWDDSLTAPAGAVGEVAVRGPQVTRRYYNRPEADALAKVADSAADEVVHRMGDLGYFDDRGRLWFCGRKAHRVVTPNETFFTIPCEGVFNTHPQVFRTALVGVSRGGVTEPVLCVELEPAAAGADRETVRRELLEIGAAHARTRSIRTILFHPAFPVDIRHNAKIFREKLAAWAAGRLR